MILVSSCLVGLNTKYNGKNNYNEKVAELVREGKAIPLCAEQLGGLMTPRVPAEIKIINGKRYVINREGKDVTLEYEKGAREVMDFVNRFGIKKAILKSKSPSCGKGMIYDGSFSGKLIDSNGVLVQILLDNGIEVISSDEFVSNEI